MGSIFRLIIGVPIAVLVTFGLFRLMSILIDIGEVQLEEAAEEIRIDISDAPEEIDARRRDTSIDDVEDVQPPPPPPQVERQAADLPTESLDTIVGDIPEFDAPDINAGNVNFNVSDRNAQPLVRIPPQMPQRALERGISGYCDMRFDVSPDGTPINIQAINCTSSIFERTSIRAVERWRYSPRVEGGVAVARRGVETRIDYQVTED